MRLIEPARVSSAPNLDRCALPFRTAVADGFASSLVAVTKESEDIVIQVGLEM
jgi:hypothetical protein